MSNIKRIASKNTIYVVLIFLVVLITIASPNFLTIHNIINLVTTESIKGLLALGVAFCILSKGIDLSPGSIVALSAVVSASLIQDPTYTAQLFKGFDLPPGIDVVIAVLAGVLAGTFFGVVNGSLIALTKIPPFIATLGSMVVVRGLAMLYTNAYPIPMLKPTFKAIGQGSIGIVPNLLIILVLFVIVGWFLLNQTRFGKNVYAIGGNIVAAEVAGINVKKNIIWIYTWSAFCASVAGVLLASRTGSGIATLGLTYELDAIAAATIGGVSHNGGVGRIGGVVAGILILGVVNNGLLLLGVSPYIQQLVKGVIIVSAVVFDMRKNAKAA
ncbi:hypothetical protein CCE28_20645 [Anaeromicrobium sediminis]|uniref:Autoinducer 2 import system permease protein LsrD n=2 Tax=Anaeromicrobium sediminis TaxID=1478221 RepID=A0A267MAQ8_9FIRM|nr:hypothetical protein CCE28_20645 [Anaeromicrobium sediminis]